MNAVEFKSKMISKLQLRNPKVVMWIVIAFALLTAIYIYWLYAKYFPSTDNAYVGANVVQVAPQVTGPIKTLHVQNYNTVKKGQVLFDIDPQPFKVAVDKAQAQLELDKQNVEALQDAIKAAEALVQQRHSEVKLAQSMHDRIGKLVKRGLATLAEGDKVNRDLSVAMGALVEAEHHLQQAIAQLGNPGQNNAQIRAAQAQLDQAKLDLEHTRIVASATGYIVNLTAREGSVVQSSMPLFSIVDSSQWWVDANFKETDLERIHAGEKATITVDTYPSHVFHGVVDNISRGSGSAFSIFPAENATGNWVKVTQRFPVRILILDPDPKFPLRIGSSSTVTINTLK